MFSVYDNLDKNIFIHHNDGKDLFYNNFCNYINLLLEKDLKPAKRIFFSRLNNVSKSNL